MNAHAPIFVAGPTGSGKSAVAVALAEILGDVEIVSADAYQVYRGMELLTAAPGAAERACVPHHLVSFLDPSSSWDAASHCRKAGGILQEIAARGHRAIIVGGSGLYVKFLSHGMSPAPPSDPTLRAELERLPLSELVDRLRRLDPEGAEATPLQNPRYVVRNLEIVMLGGKPLAHWRANWAPEPCGPGVALVRETDDLDMRISCRAARMLDEGAVDEVRSLGKLSPTAAQTLGIKQIRALLRGETTHAKCAEAIALATRQYAKRQRTWLRRESWLRPVAVAPAQQPEVTARLIAEALGLSGRVPG